MKVIVCKNYEEMSAAGAAEIVSVMQKKPDCILGLATGSTPVGMYNVLIEKYHQGEIDFSNVRSVNLDEYYPIDPTNDQSYRYFMNNNLFDHVNIDKAKTNVPNGMAKDPLAEAKRYDELIASMGGIDIQVLGIGRNGHIGFNEPADALDPNTHVTDLTDDTIDANARFFETREDVPTKAITMGIKPILSAKKILLLANGRSKRDAIKKLLEGNIDTNCPATLLNLHNNVVIVCDEEAYGN